VNFYSVSGEGGIWPKKPNLNLGMIRNLGGVRGKPLTWTTRAMKGQRSGTSRTEERKGVETRKIDIRRRGGPKPIRFRPGGGGGVSGVGRHLSIGVKGNRKDVILKGGSPRGSLQERRVGIKTGLILKSPSKAKYTEPSGMSR